MKPSIGRIVHYNYNDRIYPAVITTVWNDTCVNLTIFTEDTVAMVKTSVVLGTGADQWSWPERV